MAQYSKQCTLHNLLFYSAAVKYVISFSEPRIYVARTVKWRGRLVTDNFRLTNQLCLQSGLKQLRAPLTGRLGGPRFRDFRRNTH
jgi:hypothetical protein